MARSSRRRPDSHASPLRATSMWRVDQVFLANRGSRVEVTASLVNDDGGLRNLAVTAPSSDVVEAVRHAAKFIAGRGNVYRAWGARVRWARAQATNEQNDLVRDTTLEEEFVDAFEETLGEIRDRLR